MSAKANDYHKRLSDFMTEYVFPAEADYDKYRHEAGPNDHTVPPIIEELKAKAKERGLWNLFLPAESGLTNLEYAPLAEITGWSLEIAPEALNCAAPDTGNMETLHLFATEEQRKQWLEPLLNGEIRSAFSMTEPAVASSDARNIETSIARDGGDYVINGRKWWTSGAADPRCKVLIVMGRTNPEAASHQQQSMVLVPIDTPGVTVVRSTTVFGYQDQPGHCEIIYDNVRVPTTNLLGEEGGGFAIAQARLGPGRIHHCMRALGGAERALALMVDRARTRVAFGRPLAEQGVVREAIAKSRNEIDQARLLCEKAAWTIDQHGNKRRSPAGLADQGGGAASGLRCHRPRHPGARRRRRQRGHGAGPDVRLASRHAHLRRTRRGAHAVHRARRVRPGEVAARRGGHLTWLRPRPGTVRRVELPRCRRRRGRAAAGAAVSVQRAEPPRRRRPGDAAPSWASPTSPICAPPARSPAAVPDGFPTASTFTCCRSRTSATMPMTDGEAPHEHAFRQLMTDGAATSPSTRPPPAT